MTDKSDKAEKLLNNHLVKVKSKKHECILYYKCVMCDGKSYSSAGIDHRKGCKYE